MKDCQDICALTKDCKGFTWIPYQCLIKSTIGTSQKNEAATSGLVKDACGIDYIEMSILNMLLIFILNVFHLLH